MRTIVVLGFFRDAERSPKRDGYSLKRRQPQNIRRNVIFGVFHRPGQRSCVPEWCRILHRLTGYDLGTTVNVGLARGGT